MAKWLSSWHAEQEVRVRFPTLPLEFSEIGYLLLPSRNMAEIPLKWRKSSIQPTNQPKTTENAKTRQNAYFEMALKARTLLHTSFKNISMHSVCREKIFFVANNGEGGGGRNFRLCPLSKPPGQFDWKKLAHCTSRPCILQNKTIIRPLRHILRNLIFLTKSPCGAPGGVRTGPKLHMHNYRVLANVPRRVPDASLTHQNWPGRAVSQSGTHPNYSRTQTIISDFIDWRKPFDQRAGGVNASPISRYTGNTRDHTWENFTLAWPTFKGTRDNFKIHVNFMKPTFLCRLRQDEAYDKK